MKKESKPYNASNENPPLCAAEPAAVYGEIDNSTRLRNAPIVPLEITEDEMQRLEETYYQTHRRPCAYTLEELNDVLNCSMEDIAAGRLYTHEEVLNRFPLKW